MTGFIVATGARTASLIALGFIVATVCYGTVTLVIGPRRLARFLSWISRERQRPRRSSRMSGVVRQSEIEREVVSALLHQGANRNDAIKATARAALQAPQEFEPLFRTAVGLLRLG